MTHPTSLSLASKYCPKALDHYEARVPYDRRIFETGIAAHAALQAVGEQTNRFGVELGIKTATEIAATVAGKLISEGRSYEGTPEPPLNADRAWQGVRIALEYLEGHPLPVGPSYEIGLACDENWKPCKYRGGWLQHIADFVWATEHVDEESAYSVVISRDYKSAWPTDATALDTLQSKVRALLVAAHHPDAAVLRLETVNLRTWATFGRDLWLEDPETQRELDSWRREIEASIKAFHGPRVASPGPGCVQCPYLTRCSAAQDAIEAGALSDDPQRVARAFCAAEGLRKQLAEKLKEVTAKGVVELEDGSQVGYYVKERRKPTPDAYGLVWDDWELSGGEGRGFAKALGLGVGNLSSLAKQIQLGAPPAEITKYVDGLCETVRGKEFGILKGGK